MFIKNVSNVNTELSRGSKLPIVVIEHEATSSRFYKVCEKRKYGHKLPFEFKPFVDDI